MNSEIEIEQPNMNVAAASPWTNFRLPPFPQSAWSVLSLINDQNTSMRQLTDLISSDPALSTEVLIIANSALLAQRHRVTSILQATLLLGTRILQGVCLTVAVRTYLGKSMSFLALRNMWCHSLATALIAEQLADPATMDKGTAFTGGVLHEIGSFALAVLRPKEYAALLETHSGTPSSILLQERALFGFNHHEAGQQLIREWNLPVEFETMLRPRSYLRRRNDSWQLQDVIQISCRLADAAGFPAFPGCEIMPYEDLREAIPVRERSLFHPDVKRLAADIGGKIKAIESV